VLIDFLQGQAPAADRFALEMERGELHTTAVARFERIAGAANRAAEGSSTAAAPSAWATV